MRPFSRSLFLITVVSLAVSAPAFASGYSIFEQGAKASGMAGAFVATADDPSAIFYNVAGIAFQRDSKITLMGGTTLINFANEFTGDPNDPFTSGTQAFYDRHLFNIPNGYGLLRLPANLTAGVGIFANYGLRTDWQDPYVGRFISRDVHLKTTTVEPAIAWAPSDRFAVGFGAEYRRARVTLQRNNGIISPFDARIVDVANVYLDGDWSDGWGWNAGILFKPTPTLRFGLSHRASMDIEVTGDATFTQISTNNPQLDAIVAAGLPPNQAISTTIPFPAVTAIGVATSAIPTWDIEFDVTHTTWSRFERLLVEFAQTPAINLDREQNWEDTLSYRLGANKRLSDRWDVRMGVVYDENPQPTEAVSPILPDADRIGLTLGLGWRGERFFADVSNMFLHFMDRSTLGRSAENFNGTYETDANLFSFNFGLRF